MCPLKEDPTISNSPININDSEECTPSIESHPHNPLPNSPAEKNLSLLARTTTHSVFSIEYVKEEVKNPLATMIKKVKKRKMFEVQDATAGKKLTTY